MITSPGQKSGKKFGPQRQPSEALREFARYGELLELELGVEASERLRALVADLGAVTPR